MPIQKEIDNTASTSENWLIPCRVEPGMFRGEYLVYLDGLDPTNPHRAINASLFADEREVLCIQGCPEHGKPVPARLVVSLRGSSNGFADIILPQPAQPLGVRLLVEKDKLEKHEVPA